MTDRTQIMPGSSGEPLESPRIGLYGGSFNPPHIAHVMVAAWALASGEIDELWIIPTGGHPFGKALAPWEARVEMCWLAFQCFGERMSLLDIEKDARVHYTIDTVRTLRAQVPRGEFRWVMGSDTLADTEKWKDYDEVMRLAPPLVIPRDGNVIGNVNDHSGGGACPYALPNISSTWLREELAAGNTASLAMCVPGPVLEYITEHGLY